MIKPVRRLLAAALALACVPASAQTYSETVFFGDSLTDSGFYRPFLVEVGGPGAALTGRFTTNPGLVWSEYLADFYGTGANSAWGLTTTGIVPQDGTNYAAGGATVVPGPGFPPTPPTQFAPSLTTQVNAYLARNGGRADPNALFTVWGGANDLFFALQGAITPAQFLGSAQAQVGLVGTLTNAGAQYILVPTIPDVGLTPFGLSQGPAGSAGITQLVDAYNQTLFGGLAAANLRVIPLDTYHLIREISADPTAYGFNSAMIPACAGTSLTCVSTGSGRAFADGVHPSTEAHAIIAQYAVSVLEAPRQVAILPHSATVTGRSRAERVGLHVDNLAGDDGDLGWWMDVGGDFQRYDDGNLYDGAGPSILGGVDWSNREFVWGVFGGYGQSALDWGHRGGSFDQRELAIGGFAGWYTEHANVSAQISYAQLDYDLDRDVYLGAAKRTHNGETDGDNLSIGLSAGYEFGGTNLRHGPVASVLAQRIQIDGFSESEPTLSTSLAYPDQDFDSLIGSVGWQVHGVISDHVRPYARLTYDREFEDSANQAWARAQSMPGTGAYAVPGVWFDDDYATLTFGVRTELFGLDANIGAMATAAQKDGNNSTVFVQFGSGF
jgi:outer membrane lipase/esterase